MRGRRGRVIPVALWALVASLLPACAPVARVFPGDSTRAAACALPGVGGDFSTAAPAAAGLHQAKLRDAVAYAAATGAASVRVYRHGCLVADGGLDAPSASRPLPAFSMTKSVVAVAVGRAVQLGLLRVDDPVGPYLRAAGESPDAAKSALTIRRFLTQTTGIRLPLASDFIEAATTDSVAALLTRPFEAVPGSTFLYAQTAVTALVAVVEGATRRDFQDFVRTEVFGPLGIPDSEWRWARDGSGRTQGFAFLDMSPRSFARIGMLLGAGGVWGQRRLVPASYVDQATLGTDANPCYGFLIRSNRRPRCENDGVPGRQAFDRKWLVPAPEDTFGLSGAFDQEVTVYPGLDIVTVRMGLPAGSRSDPLGNVDGQQPKWQYRFARLLMSAVLDRPQPPVPDWTPDPEPPLNLWRILPLPVPEPWPPRPR